MEDYVKEYIRKHGHPPNFLPDPVVTEEEFQDLLREDEKLQSQRRNQPAQRQRPPKEAA